MVNDDRGGARRYQDEVPAVARAVRLLERLAAADDSQSLADLARELSVGPSSLLAILTTLRQAGLVVRDATGRYEVGPGLTALGNAASCKQRACERFAVVAGQLVEAFGETVLLWIAQEDGFVLAAAREGTQPLRFVPTPGRRLRTAETQLGELDEQSRIVEEELLPGVWTIAAMLPAGPDERACIALAGPRERVSTPAVQAALIAIAASQLGAVHPADMTRSPGSPFVEADPDSVELVTISAAASHEITAPAISGGWGAAAGPIDDLELDAFLRQSLVATLSYLADDGYPATVPLWYAWDGAAFWLASRPGSEWAEHVLLDPRVSLAVSESSPPLRRVIARGQLVEVDDPGGVRWTEVETQLAARYAGFDAVREPAAAGRGRLLKLEPERLIAWRGLLRHPRLPSGPDRPDTSAWRNLG
jgi:DNA-binding IclR family transcriptional regulator